MASTQFAIGDLLWEVGLDPASWEKLQTQLKEVSQQAREVNLKVNSSGVTKLTTAEKEAREAAQKLSNEVNGLRNIFQATGKDAAGTTARLKELRDQAVALAEGVDRDSTEFRRFATAAAQADRTVASMEGRMSRLGLAYHVDMALQQQAQISLYRFGPAGMVAAGALEGVSAGAVAAVAGIAGVGIAAGALEARGLGQVKEFTNAVNVLTASGADVSNLDAQLRQVQESAGLAGQAFSRAKLAGSLADTVKAGLDATDALKVLSAGIDLAATDGSNLNDSTALLLQNLRQFGLTADDARKAADELAAAGLDAAGSSGDLSTGLSTVGPAAKQAGLSMAETLGILVDLDNKGLSAADKGANGFRTVLLSLADPTAKARKAIEGLGVSLEDANGHARPVKDVLFDLKDALEKSGVSFDASTGKIKGNSDALRTAAEIFRTRGVTAILAMDDSVDKYTGDIVNSTGKAKDFADQMGQGLPGAEKRLSASLDDLSRDFASLTSGPLTDFLNALDGVIQKWDILINGPGQAKALQGQERLESFIKQFGSQYGQPLANLLDQIDQASAKLGHAEKTLAADKGTIAINKTIEPSNRRA